MFLLGRISNQQVDISDHALPMTELAILTGESAPMPEFMPISLRIGPLTSSIADQLEVEDWMASSLWAAVASITGKYSGFAPGITASTATFCTEYWTMPRISNRIISPTISSGSAHVP